MAFTTTPPADGRTAVLFDGNCRFCTQQSKRLVRAFPKSLRAVNFQDVGVLDSFPGVSYDACMKKMHVVFPDGKVYAGAEALSRIVIERVPALGLVGYGYYVPGVRQLSDYGYETIAKYRYKIAGKNTCEPGGSCHLHG